MSKDISKEWDYRVVRQTTEDGDEWLSVQEVYYDDETNEPMAHTTDLTLEGDTISGIRTQLQRMLWCLDKEIVDEIESNVAEQSMESRVLSLEMENAEMRDRLTELGEKLPMHMLKVVEEEELTLGDEDCGTQHLITKNKKYIYESPDGGKTVFRRPFGNHDLDKKEEIDSTTGKTTGRLFKDYPFEDKLEKGL
jgi:hypothetical protein